MRSREAFYGNMIWVVDAQPFLKNILIFGMLPDPSHHFVDDLLFVAPQPAWRENSIRRSGNFDELMYFRRSESNYQLHCGRELADYFPLSYSGHHLFLWVRPRDIWLKTTKPTYFDLDGKTIARLLRYGRPTDGLMCLQLLSKEDFVADLLNAANT